MKHIVELVESKELNDCFVGFRFRCCGDESTDSYCTLALSLTADETQETILHHKTKMAAAHDKKLSFREKTHPIIGALNPSEIVI